MEQSSYFSGAISVKAALEAGVRTVKHLYVDAKKDSRDFGYIIRLARSKNVPVDITARDQIDTLCPNQAHGGICAEVSARTYATPEELLNAANPFIVLLEGVEDPFHYGCAIRSAYAAGATGLLVPTRSWETAEDTVVRASAGASERIPTACTDAFTPVLEAAKAKGIQILAADRKDAVPLYEADMTGPVILAVGGRLRGLSKDVYNMTDKRVYIPYGRDFRNALTTSAACAVMAFEVMRQRQGK